MIYSYTFKFEFYDRSLNTRFICNFPFLIFNSCIIKQFRCLPDILFPFSETLQTIPVQVFTYKDCEVKLRNTYLGKYFILNDSFSCVATPAESELCLVRIIYSKLFRNIHFHYHHLTTYYIYSFTVKCISIFIILNFFNIGKNRFTHRL